MKALVIFLKEFKVVFRESGGLLYMFMMPVALLVVFNMIFAGAFSSSGDKPFPLPVANLDRGDLAAKVIDRLKSVEWVDVELKNADGKPYSEANAIGLVEDNQRNYALIFPADFSEKIRAGQEVKVPLYVDPALSIQFTGPVEGSVTAAFFSVVLREQMKATLPARIEQGMKDMEKDLGIQIPPFIKEKIKSGELVDRFLKQSGTGDMPGFDEKSLLAKVEKRQPPSVKREEFPTVYQQNLSGYSVLSVFFIITSIGAAFFHEKRDGTFRRILAAPVSRSAFLAGKLLPYVLVNFLQVAVLIALSVIFYHTDLGNSPLALVAITLCMSLSACGVGLLMVTLFTSEQKMESVSVVVVLISTALSGAFVPRFVMGEFVQNLSLAVPQSWALVAYQDVMVRGKGLIDVLPNCGMLLAFASVFFLFGVLRFRFE